MGKYEIKTDVSKNRLYLRLSGFFKEDEVKEAIDGILKAVEELGPGVNAISDISDFKPASPKVAGLMLGAQKKLKEKGLGKVIRVTGSNVLGKKQFERTGKEAGYSADTAATVEEAERILDRI